MRDFKTGFFSLPLLAGEGLGIGVNDFARALPHLALLLNGSYAILYAQGQDGNEYAVGSL